MRVTAPPGFTYVDPVLRDQQLATLNATLTAEVLRHAETRRQLQTVLTWCWLKERLEPVEVIREVPRVIIREVPVVITREAKAPPAKPRSHWKPGPNRQRVGVAFPLAVAGRAGLAAVIQRPLLLRSGAILDPVQVAARRGGLIAALPDSSWLVLCVLAQRAGEFVSRADLEAAVYGRPNGGSVRSALHRARRTLEFVGAEADLETLHVARSGSWRLLVAEERER